MTGRYPTYFDYLAQMAQGTTHEQAVAYWVQMLADAIDAEGLKLYEQWWRDRQACCELDRMSKKR